MWHGLIVDIPNGWALCDGSNGTPDLRGKFVLGAAADADPGGLGGTIQHKHTVTFNSGIPDTDHQHDIYFESGPPTSGDDDVTDIDGDSMEYDVHQHVVEGETESGGGIHKHSIFGSSLNAYHLPPYYTILFIIKL